MAILAFVLIAFVVPIVSCKSIGGQYYVRPNDTKTCVNDLVAWCDGMKFPTERGSISIASVTMFDSTGYSQALCIADSKGTNCTKNGSPWLNCSSTNQLFYKGNALTKDSLEGTDNGTCETADKAFNELSVQNLNSDNSTMELESGLEQFFRELQGRLGGIFRFGGGFPFYNNYPNIPGPSNEDTNTSPVKNDREME